MIDRPLISKSGWPYVLTGALLATGTLLYFAMRTTPEQIQYECENGATFTLDVVDRNHLRLTSASGTSSVLTEETDESGVVIFGNDQDAITFAKDYGSQVIITNRSGPFSTICDPHNWGATSYKIEPHLPPEPDPQKREQQRIDQMYIDEAAAMTTDALYQWLLTTNVATTSNFNSPKEIQADIFRDEFEWRVGTDTSPKARSQEAAVLQKFPHCWNIPEGYCQE